MITTHSGPTRDYAIAVYDYNIQWYFDVLLVMCYSTVGLLYV